MDFVRRFQIGSNSMHKTNVVKCRVTVLAVKLSCAGLLLIAATGDDCWCDDPEQQPDVGMLERVAWTTSQVKGSPEPPLPYITDLAFPNLRFRQCLDMAPMPGSDRLFVVEQSGKVYSFPETRFVSEPDLVVDLRARIPGLEQTYAITFHPDFERNRYCYICYIKAAGLNDGTHVARFRVRNSNPPTIDVESEKTVITWLSGGHNGCSLKFGPDGYLYISTGDGVGPSPPDTRRTGQDITDVLSSILRVDVNHPDEGRGYRIPPDNPFVGMPDARGEVWAYGLRNPWRMSFDREGTLWVGDVGWELWEMLQRIERGGNYGWSVMEGSQPTHPEWPRGPTPILPPTIQHGHHESSSITDGATYYGVRLQELYGHHVYGDYDTGKLWSFRYVDGQVTEHREIADTTLRIVGFGEGHSTGPNGGELYVLDHALGTIHRLVANRVKADQGVFPQKLSETGLFASVASQTLAAGVVPYSVNAEAWADHATSQRFMGVPGTGSIVAKRGDWSFPKDSVLAKTISLEMRSGDVTSRRPVETQILHFDGRQWRPYAYKWRDDATDADLLDASGEEQVFPIVDSMAPRGTRYQTWRYSGRGECQRCHNRWAGPLLAFDSRQLNREHPYEGVMASQLDTLKSIGLVRNLEKAVDLPWMADPYDGAASIDKRARAYLHVNCAHCHRDNAGGGATVQMQIGLPLGKTRMLNMRPTQGLFGIHSARILTPGDPSGSVLYYRMCKTGSGRMPHIGSTEVDREGIALIANWIRQLPNLRGQSEPSEGSDERRQRESVALQRLGVADQSAAHAASIDLLLGTTRGALSLIDRIESGALSPETVSLISACASRCDDAQIRDLFERFMSHDQRVERLGNVIEPSTILELVGNVERGERLFSNATEVQCIGCHRIEDHGRVVGPDLSKIGATNDRGQLLESILYPSKKVDVRYLLHVVEVSDGRVISGLLIRSDDMGIVIRDAQGTETAIPHDEIDMLAPQQKSMMPELLLRDLTAQQVADLLAFLVSLK